MRLLEEVHEDRYTVLMTYPNLYEIRLDGDRLGFMWRMPNGNVAATLGPALSEKDHPENFEYENEIVAKFDIRLRITREAARRLMSSFGE